VKHSTLAALKWAEARVAAWEVSIGVAHLTLVNALPAVALAKAGDLVDFAI